MKLPERLKEARTNAKMTQTKLAKMCNVSQGTIANWESGLRTPDLEMIITLVNLLGVSADYLLGIDESPKSMYDASILFAKFHDAGKSNQVFLELLNKLSEIQRGEIIGRMKMMIEQEDEFDRKESV